MVDPLDRVVDAVGTAHDDAVGAARAHVQLAHWIAEAVRPPPLRQLHRLDPGEKHPLARRSKMAADEELAVTASQGLGAHGGATRS
ncbi:hypothetical protein D3C71_2131810 [compost metagenome]